MTERDITPEQDRSHLERLPEKIRELNRFWRRLGSGTLPLVSKHAAGRQKAENWRRRRKVRRAMSKASRRKNRE